MNEDTPLAAPAARTSADLAATLEVAWVGDSTLSQRFASRRAPHIHIDEHTGEQLLARLQSSPDHHPDIVVIDGTTAGIDALALVCAAGPERANLPVVLLTEPGQDDLRMRADSIAVCDAIVKTPDFVHQLLPVFTQVRARHDVTSLLRTLRGDGPAPEAAAGGPRQHAGLAAALDDTGRQLADLRQQLADADAAAADVRRALEQDRNQLTLALQNTTLRCEMLAADLFRAETAARDARDRHAKAAAEVAALKQDRTQRDASATAASSDLDRLSKECGRLTRSLAEAEAAGEQAQSALTAGEARWQKARAEHDAIVNQLALEREWVEQSLASATARCEALADGQRQIDGTTHDLRARIANDTATIRALEVERDQLAGTVRGLQERQADTARAGALEGELQASERRCRHLVEELAATRGALDLAQRDAVAAAATLRASQARLEALTRVERLLTDDERDLTSLRDDLLRFLCDVDIRCKTIAQRHSRILNSEF